MHRYSLLAFFCFVSILSTLSCVRAAESCQARREYDEITALVTQEFYDQTFRGLDWPARVADYRNRVAAKHSI